MSTTTFSYTPEDLADAWRAQWRGSLFLRSLRVGPYLIIAFNLLPAVLQGVVQGHWRVGFWDAIWVGFGLFLIGLNQFNDRVMAPKRAARVLAQQVSLQGTMTASWNAEGIEFHHATGHQRLAWRDYARWIESPTMLVLVQSDAVLNLIPKRALTDEQLAEIKTFLPTTKKGR